MFIGKPEVRKLLGNLGMGGRITLKLILEEQNLRFWTGFMQLLVEIISELTREVQESFGEAFANNNETYVSIKGE